MKTNRCIVENLKKDDYEDVKLLYVDSKVREFLGGVISDEKYSSSLKEMINNNEDSLYWVIRLKDTNDFIGLVSIDIHHDGVSRELSYQFLPSYWGKGYALEVIREILNFISRELNINNLISETQVMNKASCRLLNSLGMKVVDKVYRFNAEQYIFSLKL